MSVCVQLAKDKAKIESTMSSDSRDMIRMKNQMRFELSAVENDLIVLCKQAVDEGKASKVPPPEMAARREVLETIKTEFHKVRLPFYESWRVALPL